MVSEICKCLEVLLEVKHSGTKEVVKLKNKEEAVLNALRENIHSSFKKIESYESLKSTVSLYINPCLDANCTNCDILNFLQLCIVLLKLIYQALLQEKNEEYSDNKPKGLLSISQQVIVRKCLQFIVALGIVPNLLHGIGIPKNKRLEYPDVLANITFNNTPQQKFSLLVITAEVLLECQNCDALQNIIMSYHGCDLLSTLMQLCFAPIKKIDKNLDNKSNLEKDDLLSQNFCFKKKLSLLKELSPYEENNLILEMQQRQVYFKPYLEKLMKEMCPSLLMFNFLMFNGMSKNANKDFRTPFWFQRECNFFMKKLLTSKHGIATLIKAVIDQTFDMDAPEFTTEHIESLNKLAQIVIFYPVANSRQRNTALHQQSKKQLINDDYLHEISKQVLDLLCVSGQSVQQKVSNFVASSIILQVSEYNMKLAKSCFWDFILKPLDTKTEVDSEVVVEEKELNSCIENLTSIFLFGDLTYSQHQIKVLWPHFEILFHMMSLVDNISFLKSQIKELLCRILTTVDNEKALSFLQAASFPMENPTRLIFYSKEASEKIYKVEDFDYIQNRCNGIFDILDGIKSKILNSSYLLFILKEFCMHQKNLKLGKEEMYDEKYCLSLALLTQNITDWKTDLGEISLLNLPEVVDLLMTLLENSCNEDETYDENIIMTILAFLSSMLMIDDKLTSSHWEVLQKCVPYLHRLHKCNIDSNLKALVFNVLASIATHGASSNSKAQTIKTLNSSNPKLHSQMLYPESSKVNKNTFESDKARTSKESISSQGQEASMLQDLVGKSFKYSTFKNDEINNTLLPAINSSYKTKKFQEKFKPEKLTAYEDAIKDIKDSFVPTRGHGLISLGKLIHRKDEETLSHKEEILKILQKNLEDEDSYIYLAAIQTLSILAELDSSLVIPVALHSFLYPEGKSCEFAVKIGEVLVKVCRSLGDLIHKYKDELLHAFLVGAKSPNPIIRSSSLSSLGEACLHLKFNIEGHWLQEIIVCVQSLLTTDKDQEVRRCAVMVIYLLFRGVGKDMLQVLENHIKDIYAQLKIVYNTAEDEVLKLHSQMALEEINIIMRHLFTAEQPMLKEIRIL